MRWGWIMVAAVIAAAPVQAETLADVKQDLAVLSVEVQKLKRELSTTGSSTVQVSGDVLQRLNTIESELQRVTAKAEELEFRIGQVAEDGGNRISDLQFRVCELEPGCDLSSVGQGTSFGGETAPVADAPVAAGTDDLPFDGELAVSEEADFRAAQEALDGGDNARASDLFANFRQTYPGSPLESAALVGEGQALEAQGDTREAARRYLDAYSRFPDDQIAPQALWRLGETLGKLGSVSEACVTLAEVGNRYPGSEVINSAADSRIALGCPVE
ncbi:tetratricopeptide repeat protein [Sagittula sp.]|uniref:tetratricopeptide repeat protein n=1 Tax=Sagittula sp. TaxID=2038081 RepID=UPI0035119428